MFYIPPPLKLRNRFMKYLRFKECKCGLISYEIYVQTRTCNAEKQSSHPFVIYGAKIVYNTGVSR